MSTSTRRFPDDGKNIERRGGSCAARQQRNDNFATCILVMFGVNQSVHVGSAHGLAKQNNSVIAEDTKRQRVEPRGP